MTLQPRSHVRILIYRTWTIQNELTLLVLCIYIFKFEFVRETSAKTTATATKTSLKKVN